MAEILLTGANGQLGWELRRLMTADQCVAFTSAELDITDEAAVAAMVAAVAPSRDYKRSGIHKRGRGGV